MPMYVSLEPDEGYILTYCRLTPKLLVCQLIMYSISQPIEAAENGVYICWELKRNFASVTVH
jgi:hypothetical protein